ncbi:Alpha/Beta hydrolase protein [Aspergillus cavernicola]|uniref:Alpha/Beta hydrolase protein n=1 Tax=Aspergillus cavernicola TaxID=176166 RepID=A0ABR4IJ05_9EURO
MSPTQLKYPVPTADAAGYIRTKHLYIPMRDGIELCADLFLPFSASKEYRYALPRVDVCGIGGSQGRLDPFGLERSVAIGADAEGQDLYDVTEWAGVQPYYYGMVGYWAAIQKPPHLACVLSYESQCNMYHAARRGGIYSNNFQSHWYNNIVELTANRVDYPKTLSTTEYPNEGVWAVFDRVRKLSDIQVPFYLAGNWTDPELHLAGNIRAFNGISSRYKWLEITGNHLRAFYEPEDIECKGNSSTTSCSIKKGNGMLDVPRHRILQHHGKETLTTTNPADAPRATFITQGYGPESQNINLSLDSSFTESFELLGSPYLELEVSTTAQDLDLFIYLRAIDANGGIIVLRGNHGEPMNSFARGYFCLSHRDEVARNFAAKRIIDQPNIARSEGQSLSLEIGHMNSPSTIPPMRHEGGDRTAQRFQGENVLYSQARLVLPRVHR